jgi:hypothetical protein
MSVNVDLLKYAAIWLIVIIVHEWGHYLAFRYYKHKPKLRIRMYGLVITVGENVTIKTLKQSVIILYWGVFAGLIPVVLFFHTTPINVLLYFLIAMVDVAQILIISLLSKKERNMTWLEYHTAQIEKLKVLEG